jgi:PAS domain S-box-containing protein/diguanylate cyclase (GGDEF)-like protein
MTQSLRVLHAEDSDLDAELVQRELQRAGLDCDSCRVQTEPEFRRALQEFDPQIILSDFFMPGFGGLQALRICREAGIDIPFIFISGTIGEDVAVEAMKAGADDYVMKTNLIRLGPTVRRTVREAGVRWGGRIAEAALRRAQGMAKLAHVITAPDGAFESWSDTLPGLVGVDCARMPRSTRECLDIVHPEDRGMFRDKAIGAAAQGARTELEYRLHHGNGGSVHIRHLMEPLLGGANAAGKMRWFNTLQDVTEQKSAAEALQASEERFRAMFEKAGVGITHTDLDGRFVMINPKFCSITGYSHEEARSLTFRNLTHPEDVQKSIESRVRLLEGTTAPYEREARLVRKDDSVIWVNITTSLVRAADGSPLHFISVLHDVSERKRAEIKISGLNRVLAMLSGINTLIVRVRDRGELFREACRIAVEAGGFKLAWLGIVEPNSMQLKLVAWHGIGEGYVQLMPLELSEAAPQGYGLGGRAVKERRAMISHDMTHDPRVRLKEEALTRGFHSLVVLPLLISEAPVGVLALYAGEIGFFNEEEMKLLRELAGDIAYAMDHIEKQERLDYLAYYDSLTGLANRTLFVERVKQSLHAAGQAGRKVALVLADIERLNTVNESLGRQAGDALLKQAAERLAQAAGASEIARIGADHFAVVLPNVKGKSQVKRMVEKLSCDWFGKLFRLSDAELKISARAGIALFPNDGANAEVLLSNAEAALMQAKESGERHSFYTAALTRHTAERLTLENRLRQALEKDEFVLHYQPKVDLETRRIVGAEALIRWQNPELGLVPPGQFIPLMEETGLILEAGAWALAKAAADHLRWVGSGLAAPRVAVNVSPIQLRKADFIAGLENALKHGATPPGIDLEITESLIMEDVEATIGKLKEARGLGVAIAIDDFGTGYSSLGYLAKLPVQSLKIDRSFIIAMLNDPDTMTLVRTIISLAESLRLKVVAEGVDSQEQATFLHLLRCDEMQGYLFSEPLPFDAMAALLTKATVR